MDSASYNQFINYRFNDRKVFFKEFSRKGTKKVVSSYDVTGIVCASVDMGLKWERTSA